MVSVEHGRSAARVALPVALIALVATYSTMAAAIVLRFELPERLRQPLWHPEGVAALAFGAAAYVLARRGPSPWTGPLMATVGATAALSLLSLHLGPWLELHDRPGASAVEWLGRWAWALDFSLIAFVLPLSLPGARTAGPRQRWALGLAASVPAIVCLRFSLAPEARPGEGTWIYPLDALPWQVNAILVVTLAATLFSVGSSVRSASPDTRRQIAWAMYALVPAQVLLFSGDSLDLVNTLRDVAITAVPVGIVIAITKFRLYEIEVVLNRTLVYLGVAGVLAVAYVTVAGLVELVTPFDGRPAGAVAIGAAFVPARRTLQRAIDRVMHGERDPYRLADRLQQRLQSSSAPDIAAATAASTVREALRAAWVMIEIFDREGRVVATAESGVPDERPRRVVPLVWHGEPVGRLRFGVGRRPDARLTSILARDLAELAGAARLAADVQRSRARILRMREEERRRLRRDLHDGLGPTLASLAMTVDAARITLRKDPEAVDALLENLRSMMGRTIGDIRELVYDLRPPALDDLGLAGAIRALGGVVATGDGPRVDVVVEGDLTQLPAAAEVAAYRIVQEALTNVHRHSKANAAIVSLYLTEELSVTVGDDGVGMPPDIRSGVGLSSMRERAAELGGSCTVGPGPEGGTVVRARLPVTGNVN
ncbi:sensor histidine kinase [Spirillospora sp. CA-294931]|uniref:sensor histidine kinase n=1 Tax=Spirillospora sp. CA-294931 TaxID=3240042 RepID=UPI003D8E1E0B